MSGYLVLARAPETADALRKWAILAAKEAGDPAVAEKLVPALIPRLEVLTQPGELFDWAAAEILNGFDTKGGRLPLDGCTILVDIVEFSKLQPLHDRVWEAGLSMLVLAFPEAFWVFAIAQSWGDLAEKGSNSRSSGDLWYHHGLPAMFRAHADPLMDVSGLRDHVRERASSHRTRDNARPAEFLPRRKEWAAALDDESTYAYLNAYTAYRNGYRAAPIRRNAVALELFGDSSGRQMELPHSSLVFEDVFLNYPDRNPNDRYSDLSESRVKKLPRLENADYRVIVTSGHGSGTSSEVKASNRRLIEQLIAERRGAEVRKPFLGMFDLWRRARLDGKRGEGFVWPPSMTSMASDETAGHSAPGRLLQVAEHLIDRATRCLHSGVDSLPEAVRGAVLANDALELLGDRTPTTAIAALELKHRFEVIAECQFSGVQYHLDVESRLEEIRRECNELAGWFSRREARSAALNAEMYILNSLARTLDDNNQFDEEQVCMNRVRHLHNRLWAGLRPHRWIVYPLLVYSEFVMGSFAKFVFALLSWIVLLIGGYWGASQVPLTAQVPELPKAVLSVMSNFTGASVPDGQTRMQAAVLLTSAIVGLSHLGIFISYLYSRVARK